MDVGVKLIYVVTLLPLKKTPSSIGAPMVSGSKRPLLYPPPFVGVTPPPIPSLVIVSPPHMMDKCYPL